MTTAEQSPTDPTIHSTRVWRRHPLFQLVVVGLALLLLAVQPNALRLIEITRATRSAESAESALPLLLEGYARQPWNAGRAEAAGYGALLSGDYNTAVEMFTAAAELRSWTPALHVAAGDAYNGLEDTDAALTHWEAARDGLPRDENLLIRLSATYERQRRYSEAADALQTLAAIRPTDAATHYRLGLMLAVLDPEAAQEHLALASGLDAQLRPLTEPLDAALDYALALDEPAPGAGLIGYTLINLQEFGLAEAALQAAIEYDPTFADAYAYLGLAEDRQGGDGLAAYQRALEINPESALAHSLLGLYWKRQGDGDQALAALERAYDLDPLNAAVSAELGSLHETRADLPSAEEWYQNAVRLAPTDPAFWTLLARFYLDNDFKVAAQGYPAAQTAAQHGPVYAPAHDVLGYAHLLLGQPDEAEQILLRAIELDSELASAYYHLGLVYAELGRRPEAEAALQRAIALDPDGPTGNRALNTLARLPQE